MSFGSVEAELLRRLEACLAPPAVKSRIDAIAEGVARKLGGEPSASMAWEPVALDVYGAGLAPIIRSNWVFILRARATTGAEPHPNSHQRVMAYRGTGDLQVYVDDRWRSHPLASGPGGPIGGRWASIHGGTWHQAVVPDDDWVVVSFHTAPADELIEERPDPDVPGSTRRRTYRASRHG